MNNGEKKKLRSKKLLSRMLGNCGGGCNGTRIASVGKSKAIEALGDDLLSILPSNERRKQVRKVDTFV